LISSSKELIERELRIAQGTICAQKSFDTKVSFILQEGHIMLIPLMVKLLFAK
jgi:hypothetical protein